MTAWLSNHGWWVALVSMVTMLVGSVVAVRMIIQLPADYLQRHDRPIVPRRHPAVHFILMIARNSAGIVFLLLGLLMSVPLVPGPGVLLLIVGLMLMDFPRKRRIERRVLASRFVLSQVNRLRGWLNCAPMLPPARTG